MPATSEPAPGSVIPRRADQLALDRGHQVALLLVLGAEQVDRRRRHVGVDREAHVEPAAARVAHRVGADQRVEVVAALAAVLLRVAEADEAEVGGALQDRVGPEVLLPLEPVRGALLQHPRLHRLAQLLVLVGEDEVLALGAVVGLDDGLGRCGHGCCSLSRCAGLGSARAPAAKWIVGLLTSYCKSSVVAGRSAWAGERSLRSLAGDEHTTNAELEPGTPQPRRPGLRGSPGLVPDAGLDVPADSVHRALPRALRAGLHGPARARPQRGRGRRARRSRARWSPATPTIYRAGDANGIVRPVVGAELAARPRRRRAHAPPPDPAAGLRRRARRRRSPSRFERIAGERGSRAGSRARRSASQDEMEAISFESILSVVARGRGAGAAASGCAS